MKVRSDLQVEVCTRPACRKVKKGGDPTPTPGRQTRDWPQMVSSTTFVMIVLVVVEVEEESEDLRGEMRQSWSEMLV